MDAAGKFFYGFLNNMYMWPSQLKADALYRSAAMAADGSVQQGVLLEVNRLMVLKLQRLGSDVRRQYLQYVADYTFRYDNILRLWLRGRTILRADVERHLKWGKWGIPSPTSSQFENECMHKMMYCFDQKDGCDDDQFGKTIFPIHLNQYMKDMVTAFNEIAVPCPVSILYRGLSRGTGRPLEEASKWKVGLDDDKFSVLQNDEGGTYIFIKHAQPQPVGTRLKHMTVDGTPGVLVNCAIDLGEIPGFHNVSISTSTSRRVGEEFAQSGVVLRIHAEESCKVIGMQVCTYFPNEDELLLFSNGALVPYACEEQQELVFIDCHWRHEGEVQIPPWPVSSLFEGPRYETTIESAHIPRVQQTITSMSTHPPSDLDLDDFEQDWGE